MLVMKKIQKYFHRDLELDNCEKLLNILKGDNK